jgi:hypothetical protein
MLFSRRRRRREPAPIHSPAEPEFWRRLPEGSSIALRDFQALEEAELTGGGDGLNYAVTGKRHYTFHDAGGGVVAEYVTFDLAAGETTYVLIAVCAAAATAPVELRVYYRPDGFEPGTRAAVLAQGNEWLFMEPANPDSYVPYELEFARYPHVPPIRDGDEEREFTFEAVGSGPLYGEHHDARAGRRVPALIMEYRTRQPASNPLLLVLEEGGLDLHGEAIADGGFVTLLLGSTIDLSQMDVYPA